MSSDATGTHPPQRDCPFCGEQIRQSDHKCPHCGKSLASVDQQDWERASPLPADNPAPKSASVLAVSGLNPIWVFGIIAVAFIATLSFYASVLKEGGDSQTDTQTVRPAVAPVPDTVAATPNAPRPVSPQATQRTQIAKPRLSPRSQEAQLRYARIKSLSQELYQRYRSQEIITPNTVHLTSGESIPGTILHESDTDIKYRSKGLTTTIPKDKIERIEVKSPPQVDRELQNMAFEQAIRIVNEGLVRHGDEWLTPEERDMRVHVAKAKADVQKIEAQQQPESPPPQPKAPSPTMATTLPVPKAPDYATATVIEGYGIGEIVLGNRKCTKQFIKARLGKPDREEKRFLGYNDTYGFDLIMASDADMVVEMHFNGRFKGKLASDVQLNSSMQDVFTAYGQPVAEENVESLNWDYRKYNHATLYRKDGAAKIHYMHLGLLFWFRNDHLVQIVLGRI